MSSIRVRARKDGSSYTQVMFRLPDGTQTSESFEDHLEALKWQVLLDRVGPQKAREVLNVALPEVGLVTVGDVCRRHLAQLTGVEKGTKDEYKRYIERDIDPAIGALPACAYDDEADAEWVNAMEGSGQAAKTIRNKHAFLSAAMETAVRAKDIPVHRNPCSGRRLPRVDRDEMVFLTHAEFGRVLSCMPKFWWPLTQFLVLTGMRWGEATALQVRDFDPVERTVKIRRAWKWTRGGRESSQLGKPKTRRSRRKLKLSETAWSLVADRLDRDPDSFVFTNTTGGVVRSGTFYDGVWKRAVAYANGEQHVKPRTTKQGRKLHVVPEAKSGLWVGLGPLPKSLSIRKRPRIHDLRHTCASWMILDRVSLGKVSRYLGHESISTTMDIYGHLDMSTMDDTVAATEKMVLRALDSLHASSVQQEFCTSNAAENEGGRSDPAAA